MGLAPRKTAAFTLSGRLASPGYSLPTQRRDLRRAQPRQLLPKTFPAGWPRRPKPPSRRASAARSPAPRRKQIGGELRPFRAGGATVSNSNDSAPAKIVPLHLNGRPQVVDAARESRRETLGVSRGQTAPRHALTRITALLTRPEGDDVNSRMAACQLRLFGVAFFRPDRFSDPLLPRPNCSSRAFPIP